MGRRSHASHCLALAVMVSGCAGESSASLVPPDASGTENVAPAAAPEPVLPTRVYQSTASVGDFIQVTLDTSAQTLSYVNRTNGLTARDVPYTVDATGVYSFDADPNGHLKRGIELAGYAFVLDVDKAGPGRDTRALAIGAPSLPISVDDLIDRRYGVMRFRTRSGGMEVGDVALHADAGRLSLALEEYWPRGAMTSHDQAFRVGATTTVAIEVDSGEKDFLRAAGTGDGGTDQDIVFKTAAGLSIDTSNGNLILSNQPAQRDFDPSWAGHYRALVYRKAGALGGPDDAPEPGSADVAVAEVNVGTAGHLAAADVQGQLLVEGDLLAVANADYLTGPGRFDPSHANGMFTFRKAAAGGYQDIFVTFSNKGMLFTSFTPESADGGNAYDYFYGAALKH